MSVKGIYWFLQVCLQCILYENLCIGELWKIVGVCKMSTGKYDVYRMCPGKTQTLGTDNVMVLVRLLLLLLQENILSLLERILASLDTLAGI